MKKFNGDPDKRDVMKLPFITEEDIWQHNTTKVKYYSWSWPLIKQPYKCPVCKGRGTVPVGFYGYPTGSNPTEDECQSCQGTGIIWG